VKEVRGRATAAVVAPLDECFELLAAVDRYSEWYPEVVRELEVVERDGEGRPTKVRATLHLARGPLVKDFRLVLLIGAERPETVRLTRIPHDRADHEQFEVVWRLEEEGASTRIRLELEANLSIPRLVPIGDVGDAMAEGFVVAATRRLGSDGR
jgi:ribosome-associated toxin RatA of RatAB toxin-antitoxin module